MSPDYDPADLEAAFRYEVINILQLVRGQVPVVALFQQPSKARPPSSSTMVPLPNPPANTILPDGSAHLNGSLNPPGAEQTPLTPEPP